MPIANSEPLKYGHPYYERAFPHKPEDFIGSRYTHGDITLEATEVILM